MENIRIEQIRNLPDYGKFMSYYAGIVGIKVDGQLGRTDEIDENYDKALKALKTLINCYGREIISAALETSGFTIGMITNRFPTLSRSLIPTSKIKHKKLKQPHPELTKETQEI